MKNKHDIISQLDLQPHPSEGGYFRRTYESAIHCHPIPNSPEKDRRVMTSIFYLLTDDSPIGYLHQNRSDIVHYFHLGSPIHYLLVSPEGDLEEVVLGSDLNAGQQLQMTVPGGYWKTSYLHNPSANQFGLISEAVAPGFDEEDNQLATPQILQDQFPHLLARLDPYLKK